MERRKQEEVWDRVGKGEEGWHVGRSQSPLGQAGQLYLQPSFPSAEAGSCSSGRWQG